MKLNTTSLKPISSIIAGNFWFKKTALAVLLFCCTVYTVKGQSQENNTHHEDTTIVLERSAFTISVDRTTPGVLKFEIRSNLIQEIGPFFIETYIKGYNLNVAYVEQTLNDAIVTENIERVFGSQFMGLGLSTLPPLGIYRTILGTESMTNELPGIQIRISGTLNGQHVIWFGSFSF